MYPHLRILLATLTFSASLGALIALMGLVAAVWISSSGDPSIDGAVRGAVGIILLVPGVVFASAVISLPLTYASIKWQPRSFKVVALMCLFVATCIGGLLFLVGLPLSSALYLAALLGGVFVVAAYAWWLVLPRTNNLFSQTAHELNAD